MEYTVDEWEAHFKPIVNHLDPQASWQTDDGNGTGIMFETFGQEWEFVASQDENKVWSYMDDDEGNLILCGSFEDPDDVIGYFVCAVPRPEEVDESAHICITIATAEERD